jgi:aspergillopepsin I
LDHDDGAAALRRAYFKHNLILPAGFEKRQLPPSPVAPAGPKETASVIALTDQNDLEYLSPVNIGGSTMRMDFDTGSSDL